MTLVKLLNKEVRPDVSISHFPHRDIHARKLARSSYHHYLHLQGGVEQ